MKKNRALPLPSPLRAEVRSDPSETKGVSDGAKLLYQEFAVSARTAMQGLQVAQQALQLAEEMIAKCMMQKDGLSSEDGWVINLQTMQYEKHKKG